MTQALSENASAFEGSINILSVAVYRNQVLNHELREPHSLCDISATFPCGLTALDLKAILYSTNFDILFNYIQSLLLFNTALTGYI